MVSFAASQLRGRGPRGRVARARQSRQAEQRREDVERLYTLSQEMMLHEDAAGLIRESAADDRRASSRWRAWCSTSVTWTSSMPPLLSFP